MIERSHRTLSNMLRSMLLEKKDKDWSPLLPSVMLYMNSMVQEKAGVSACEILMGNNPNLPQIVLHSCHLLVRRQRRICQTAETSSQRYPPKLKPSFGSGSR